MHCKYTTCDCFLLPERLLAQICVRIAVAERIRSSLFVSRSLVLTMSQELCPGERHGGSKCAADGAHGQVKMNACCMAAAAAAAGWFTGPNAGRNQLKQH